ncbi:hypothetical protein EJ06DRAFT_42307 [Trichodelitschia bisporula]|uniref:Uncharacterized protein n=1 Tax=Trichodelitschia bisporula TaxID=703511 RepID=A0A6G1HVV4_9PEZI|nr:hypothetical protein EJ06DRAFT_42307 [Trichodelitschia bisporula]
MAHNSEYTLPARAAMPASRFSSMTTPLPEPDTSLTAPTPTPRRPSIPSPASAPTTAPSKRRESRPSRGTKRQTPPADDAADADGEGDKDTGPAAKKPKGKSKKKKAAGDDDSAPRDDEAERRKKLENSERAYVAASRRSDRSIEARLESAREASRIHKQRCGRGLKITEEAVVNEEQYLSEDDGATLQARMTSWLAVTYGTRAYVDYVLHGGGGAANAWADQPAAFFQYQPPPQVRGSRDEGKKAEEERGTTPRESAGQQYNSPAAASTPQPQTQAQSRPQTHVQQQAQPQTYAQQQSYPQPEHYSPASYTPAYRSPAPRHASSGYPTPVAQHSNMATPVPQHSNITTPTSATAGPGQGPYEPAPQYHNAAPAPYQKQEAQGQGQSYQTSLQQSDPHAQHPEQHNGGYWGHQGYSHPLTPQLPLNAMQFTSQTAGVDRPADLKLKTYSAAPHSVTGVEDQSGKTWAAPGGAGLGVQWDGQGGGVQLTPGSILSQIAGDFNEGLSWDDWVGDWTI